MAILPVLQYPHPVLLQKTLPVTSFDENLKNMLKDFIDTMYHEQGVGLAANQVGIGLRIFVMDTTEEGDKPLCIINPELINQDGEEVREEGCLSVKGVSAKVKRATQVSLRYQDEQGQFQQLDNVDGLTAVCIQHEIDHLNGKLYIDHLSSLKRKLILDKFNKHLRLNKDNNE